MLGTCPKFFLTPSLTRLCFYNFFYSLFWEQEKYTLWTAAINCSMFILAKKFKLFSLRIISFFLLPKIGKLRNGHFLYFFYTKCYSEESMDYFLGMHWSREQIWNFNLRSRSPNLPGKNKLFYSTKYMLTYNYLLQSFLQVIFGHFVLFSAGNP